MNTLLLIILIALVILIFINSSNNKSNKELFQNLNYNDTINLFKSSTPSPLNNGINPENYDNYKLIIRINRFRNFTFSSAPRNITIQKDTEYNKAYALLYQICCF